MKKNEIKHLAVAGGGTGGHIFPALAVAAKMKEIMPEVKISYLGKQGSLEEKMAATGKLDFYAIPSRPLQRKLSLSNLMIPFTLLSGALKTRAVVKHNNIQAILGTGGYVSVPALMGARWAGIRTFLQEQNSYPGLATKLYARKAEKVFLAYPQAKKYLKASGNICPAGNPLRPNFEVIDREHGREFFKLDKNKKTLLVFGGSQGAQALNDKIMRALPVLKYHNDLQIIWQAGKFNFGEYESTFKASGQYGIILEFIERMEMAYAAADLAFCRAGALSLSELAVCGLPAILVPYPFAAEDHQYHNARVFENQGAAKVIRQADLDNFALEEYILKLLGDKDRLERMSTAARSLADPQASEKIVRKIIEVMGW